MRKPITAKVDDSLVAAVDVECKKRGKTRSDAVAEGLAMWLATKPDPLLDRRGGSLAPVKRSPHDEVTPIFKADAEKKPGFGKRR